MQIVVKADFHCGQGVIAAAESEALAGNGWVGASDLRENLLRCGDGLLREAG